MEAGKNSVKKNVFRIIWIIYAVASILIVFTQINKMLVKDNAKVSKHVDINENWNVTIGKDEYKNVSLSRFKFSPVSKGEKITMETILPNDWDIKEGALRLHIRQSAVRLYIDNEMIYEYGHDRMKQGKTIGSGYQFISFPKDYQGKHFKIEMNVSEKNAFSNFDEMQIYEWKNVYRALVTENRMTLFLGIFLIMLGFVTFIITMIAVLFSSRYIRLICIAAFSICVGLWTMCYTNVILIFSIPLYSVSLVEYMTLFLSPLSLIIYMYEDTKKIKNKIINRLYWVLLTSMFVFDVVSIILHTMDIVHCAAMLIYFQIIVICLLIYFAVVLVLNLKSGDFISRLNMTGMMFVAFCIGYDLIDYYSSRYFASGIPEIKGISCIGMMVFAFILFIGFYYEITRKILKEAEQKSLIKRAYTDELTQIHNRRYCAEYMDKIDIDEEGCIVICFDLNNLKLVNDTQGHAKGDVLIKSAAQVIENTFELYGVVGRMGGDEFIAILQKCTEAKLHSLVNDFMEKINKKNKEIAGMELLVAYGYASSDELPADTKQRNIEHLYSMADKRMYENKRQYKARP